MKKKIFLILLVICSCTKDPLFYNLNIKINPDESGVVNPDSGTYLSGTIIDANAIPTENYVFENWTEEIYYSKRIISDKSNIRISIDRNTDITANFIKNPSNDLIEFSFLKENNVGLKNDIFFKINGEDVYAYYENFIDPTNLIPTFKHNAKTIEYNSKTQISGESINNFTNIISYKLTAANGDIKFYKINFEFFTKLPIILIKTENNLDVSSKDEYIKGELTFIGRNYENTNYTKEIKIRGRGHLTWSQPKKPYQIKFKKKTPLLDMRDDKKWIFLANYIDKTMSRTSIAFEMGHMSNLNWTPNSDFSEIFLNNEYIGTYQISEKIEVDTHRLNIGENGFLLELDHISRIKNDDVYFKTKYLGNEIEGMFKIKSPEISNGSNEYNYIKNYILDFENILYSDDFNDPVNGYKKFIDVDSFVDWFLINEISRNHDAGHFFSSIYMNLIPGEKLRIGPIWDFDVAFGNQNSENYSTSGFHVKNAPWIKLMFRDRFFIERVKDRMKFFYGNKDRILSYSNNLSKKLHKSRIENNKIWQTLGVYIYPNYVYNFSSFQEEHDWLNNWIIKRLDWLNEEINKL